MIFNARHICDIVLGIPVRNGYSNGNVFEDVVK